MVWRARPKARASAGTSSVTTEPEEPLTLSLPSEGPMVLMTTEVPEGELIPRLRAVASERQSGRIYLRADGSVAYARVMEVMGALNAAGFRDIVLVTDSGGPRMDG